MATVGQIQEKIKYIDKDYQFTAMFFHQPEANAIVLLPDHKLAVLTDIPMGVAAQLGPWQGIEIDGVEMDARNYRVINLKEEN